MLLQPAKIPAKTDFVELVYNVLVDAIIDGTLTPGERITQEEIAEQLHVSRSPVLQALRLLKKDGLIEDAPGRGVQVTPLDSAWVGHLYEVRGALDALAARLAIQAGAKLDPGLIVRGRANLLDQEAADLDRIRVLFDDLERKRDIVAFLELAEQGEGVRIFIGSENKLFSLSGSALVVSPYMNADRKIVGAVGVIGPTRLNYGRIVPIVDYTAQLVGRVLSGRKG